MKKINSLIVCMFCICCCSCSQLYVTDTEHHEKNNTITSPKTIVDTIHLIVDELPLYPGGPEKMHEFIHKNFIYPESTVESCVQGRVFVKMIITKTGEISKPYILRGLEKDIDNEVLRVVSGMPKWIPAKKDGEYVDSYFIFPIRFMYE